MRLSKATWRRSSRRRNQSTTQVRETDQGHTCTAQKSVYEGDDVFLFACRGVKLW